MQQIKLTRDTRTKPKCPHCSTDLDDVSFNELKGSVFGKRYVYFCSACRSILGVSHRKGFWMG